ncbi:PREDICTED: arginine-fifty homeobox-like [Myotis brandtii]|uniref:arginine-fifty homeobox-like n=1 Tax=Myotis brandtii TaxID=109478 RepID=UPI0003BB8F7B|nr:PREDICTED: arginine-fifty homeobox-like [Myotis brandtii]
MDLSIGLVECPHNITTGFPRASEERVNKQQQQLLLRQPNQILPTKNVPTSHTTSTSPFSPPATPCPCNLARDSVITKSPTSDVQMQDPPLERLEASVPALLPDAYTTEQII